MSATGNCDCACPTPEIVEVPGVEGGPGAAGAAGAAGVGPYTLLTEDAVFADTVSTVQVSVGLNTGFAVGQTVFSADPSPGTDHGTFEVISKTGTTVIGLRYTAAPGDTAAPFTIGSGGILTATGATGALSAALPTAFTDNSGGTASNTIATGVGIYTLVHPLSSLATGLGVLAIDLLTGLTIGHRFQLLSFDFVTTIVGAGAGASQVFNLEIVGTDVTGGTVTTDLASTNTIGEISAGTAITGADIGAAGGTISIEMQAGGTVFTSGAGYFVIRVKNLDTSDAIASLADHVDDLITALT